MSVDFSALADGYDASQVGYSAELYAALAERGLATSGNILDIGCGTGLASEPLTKLGAKITGIDASPEMLEYARARMPAQTWQQGRAEHLDFPDNTFDGAISAQAFGWFDRPAAMREAVRVVKPDGVIGIWWKHLMSEEPFAAVLASVAAEFEAPPPFGGLTGGFVEFYSAPLRDHSLRVVPWRIGTTVDRMVGIIQASAATRLALGSSHEAFAARVETVLAQRFGGPQAPISVGFLQYLYTGKKL